MMLTMEITQYATYAICFKKLVNYNWVLITLYGKVLLI